LKQIIENELRKNADYIKFEIMTYCLAYVLALCSSRYNIGWTVLENNDFIGFLYFNISNKSLFAGASFRGR